MPLKIEYSKDSSSNFETILISYGKQVHKGNNKITEHRAIFQRERQNS